MFTIGESGSSVVDTAFFLNADLDLDPGSQTNTDPILVFT
jgi:hypothetical protein